MSKVFEYYTAEDFENEKKKIINTLKNVNLYYDKIKEKKILLNELIIYIFDKYNQKTSLLMRHIADNMGFYIFNHSSYHRYLSQYKGDPLTNDDKIHANNMIDIFSDILKESLLPTCIMNDRYTEENLFYNINISLINIIKFSVILYEDEKN